MLLTTFLCIIKSSLVVYTWSASLSVIMTGKIYQVLVMTVTVLKSTVVIKKLKVT